MEEEENIKKPKFYEIGSNLENFSIEDLEKIIKDLNNEITRIETEINTKQKAKNIADKYFQ